MKKKMKILRDTSDWLSGKGILNIITENFNDVPWYNKVEPTDLDLDYYSNHSGTKYISNLVEIMLNENGVLSDDKLVILARLIHNKYIDNWKRAFYAFSVEYNPVYNYKGHEESTDITDTTYSGSEINDQNVEDVNKDNVNHGIVTTDEKVFPTARKTIVTESGEKIELLSFPQSRLSETKEQGLREDKLSFDARKESETEIGQEKDELTFEARKDTNKESGQKEDKLTFDGRRESETELGQEKDELTFDDRTDTESEHGQKEDKLTFDERKDTESEQGQKEDKLTFDQREKELTLNGQKITSRNYQGNDNYKTSTKEWGKSYTQNRHKGLTNNLVITDDSETLTGVGNDAPGGSSGAGGTPSSAVGASNGTETIETGKYSDTEHFDQYKETTKDDGIETHTTKVTAVGGNGKYTTEKEYDGKEIHTIKTTGIGGSGKYTKERISDGKETHTITKTGLGGLGNYTKDRTQFGKEIHTIKTTGIDGSGNYEIENSKSGKEIHTITKTGLGGSGNYIKDRTQSGKEIHAIKTTGLNGTGDYLVTKEEKGTEQRKTTTKGIDNDTDYKVTTEEQGSEKTTNIQTNYQKINTHNEKSFEDRLDHTKFTHEFDREGNYGMVTSQEMLNQEMELRKKYSNLFDTIVFRDIDAVLTINVFQKQGGELCL